VKKKILATLVAICCFGALAVVPATSVAATPHVSSPYGTCTGAYSTYSTCKNVKPKLYNVKASDWWKGKFTFSFGVERGSSKAFGTKSIKVTLPKGITWNKKKYSKNLKISAKHTLKLENKSTLLVTLKSATNKFTFGAKSAATVVSKSAKKAKNITVKVAATTAGKKTYKLSYSKKAPKPKKHHKKHHHKKHHKKKKKHHKK
jgi:biopolymer transport protein ExbD